MLYRFVLGSPLDKNWRFLFEGMQIDQIEDKTTLTGLISDQAQLFGVLKKIQNAGIILISINPIN